MFIFTKLSQMDDNIIRVVTAHEMPLLSSCMFTVHGWLPLRSCRMTIARTCPQLRVSIYNGYGCDSLLIGPRRSLWMARRYALRDNHWERMKN